MNPNELSKVKSRLHLPDPVIKFIQKRYSSLLLGDSGLNPTRCQNTLKCANKDEEAGIKQGDKDEETECEVEEVELIHQAGKQSIDLVETTELTVVKEFYVNDAKQHSHSSINNDHLQQIQQQQQHQQRNNNEIMKVDEETLYIVEKRRRVQQNGTTPVEEIVDSEIRKNFELKTKDKDNNCVNTNNMTINNRKNNNDCDNPSKIMIVPTTATTPTEIHEVYSKKLSIKTTLLPKNMVKKLIDDLKVSINDFNEYIQQLHLQQPQPKTIQPIQTEINDYQLHFFKVCFR